MHQSDVYGSNPVFLALLILAACEAWPVYTVEEEEMLDIRRWAASGTSGHTYLHVHRAPPHTSLLIACPSRIGR